MTTVVAWVALILAAADLAAVLAVGRQGADTLTTLRAHRRTHAIVLGSPDPDRRHITLELPHSAGPEYRRPPVPPRA